MKPSGSQRFGDLAGPSSRGHALMPPVCISEPDLWAPRYPSVYQSDAHGMPSVGARSVTGVQWIEVALTLLLLNRDLKHFQDNKCRRWRELVMVTREKQAATQ